VDGTSNLPVETTIRLNGAVICTHGSEAWQVIAAWNERQYAVVENLFKEAVHRHGNMRGRQRLFAAAFIGLMNTCIGMWLNNYTDLDDDLMRSSLRQFQHGIYS